MNCLPQAHGCLDAGVRPSVPVPVPPSNGDSSEAGWSDSADADPDGAVFVGSYLPTMVQGASTLYWPVWFGKLSRFGLRLQQHQGCEYCATMAEGSCSFLYLWLSALTFFPCGNTHARTHAISAHSTH